MLMYHSTYTCDFCGSSSNVAGNDMLGVEMQSSIGISSFYRKLEFNDASNSIINNKLFSSLVQGTYAPKNWVDIRVNIPLVLMMNKYNNDKIFRENKISLGDVQLLSNYNIWKKTANDSIKCGQKINVGLGLELPTGKEYNTQNDILQNINFGSQSVDFLFNILYAITKNDWNFIQTGQVKINTYNANKFKYGNNYSYQFITNYVAYVGKSNLVPSLGSRIDIASKNLHNNIIQNKSGFYVLSMQAGMEWIMRNFHLGIVVQQPITQNTSMKLIKQKTLTNIYFKYQFKKK